MNSKVMAHSSEMETDMERFRMVSRRRKHGTYPTLESPKWSKPMPVVGQGVFIFRLTMKNAFSIAVKHNKVAENICLDVKEDSARFLLYNNNTDHPKTLASISTKTVPCCGYERGKRVSYWFSFDRNYLVLKYGKGYRMEETTLMTYDFLKDAKTADEQKKIRDEYYSHFNAENNGFVEFYEHHPESLGVEKNLNELEMEVEFEKHPFLCNLSPLVLDSSKTTLFTLDSNKYMLSGSLPHACKVLYENIRSIELDWPADVDDVKLSNAIRYSIDTKGCLLNKKLEEKKKEFGNTPKPKETYLRVTLGQSHGNSPGIPYVLEIWPAGHYSPIHNHGNANAVVKVLHGSINISIFNKHVNMEDADPLKKFDAEKGDVTWINRNWYQTHQLKNVQKDFCATIQCYNYDEGDTRNWPYFDYIKDNQVIDEFLPNSDFSFREMREKVLKEYRQSME